MHLNCTGNGPAIVVLEAGLGDSSLGWSSVQKLLSQNHRVCSYDRAGLAWSDQGPAEWDALIAVEQLRTLLRAANEKPPYVLVGHSAGANYTRLYGLLYPQEVRALVLVEPPLITEIPPAYSVALRGLRYGIGALSRIGVVRALGQLGLIGILYGGSRPPAEVAKHAWFLYRPQSISSSNREVDALPSTLSLLARLSRPAALNEIPLFVVSARSSSPTSQALNDALQDLASLSTRGRVLFVNSSHFVHFDNPQALVDTVLEAIEASQ